MCLDRLVLTKTAALALDEFLQPAGALRASDGQDLLLHITQMVDCLAYEGSEIRPLKSGKVMIISGAVFRGDLVDELDLFRLPVGGLAPGYVSERFVEAVREHGLRGLDFWPCHVV